jgi:hypothetical protein
MGDDVDSLRYFRINSLLDIKMTIAEELLPVP